MVYMGNICKVHETLTDDQEIILRFDSGNSITIRKEDTIVKENGDLKIIRDADCIVYVDTAFVKFISVARRFL